MSFCSHCGGKLTFEGAKFCGHCGQPQTSTPGPVAVGAPARVPEKPLEETLFNDPQVTVTTTRFIVPGQTYPVAGITSISNSKESSMAPIILILVGVGIAVIGLSLGDTPGGGSVAVMGGLMFVIGILCAALMKTKHHVVLTTAGGEVKAFTSTDGELVDDVVLALNQAIIRRG
jgi:hypothetical protein